MGFSPLTIFRNKPVFYPTGSTLLASEASEALLSLQMCGKMRYHMSSLAASPVQHRGIRELEPEEPVGRRGRLIHPCQPFGGALVASWRPFRPFTTKTLSSSQRPFCSLHMPHLSFPPPPSEREAKFGWNSWLPWQRFVPPQRIGTGTGLSMSVCRQDLGHALC